MTIFTIVCYVYWAINLYIKINKNFPYYLKYFNYGGVITRYISYLLFKGFILFCRDIKYLSREVTNNFNKFDNSTKNINDIEIEFVCDKHKEFKSKCECNNIIIIN